MNNTDRIKALAVARDRALVNAEAAQGIDPDEAPSTFTQHLRLAEMWSAVAQAMKVGTAIDADGARPSPVENRPSWLETREGV